MSKESNYINKLYEAYFESAKQFDKQILFISSGALGISFGFIKDIVKLEEASCKISLIASWLILTLVILMSLISHYMSKQAINAAIEANGNIENPKSLLLNKIVKYLNLYMMFMLLFGIVLLISFVGINI